MTLTEMREKCKGFVATIPRDLLIIAVLTLSSSLSFWLGYLAGQDAGKGSPDSLSVPLSGAVDASIVGQVVASKNGTKYYLPSCAGATRISEANKVWFPSVTAATNAGYSPAANCPGI